MLFFFKMALSRSRSGAFFTVETLLVLMPFRLEKNTDMGLHDVMAVASSSG